LSNCDITFDLNLLDARGQSSFHGGFPKKTCLNAALVSLNVYIIRDRACKGSPISEIHQNYRKKEAEIGHRKKTIKNLHVKRD